MIAAVRTAFDLRPRDHITPAMLRVALLTDSSQD